MSGRLPSGSQARVLRLTSRRAETVLSVLSLPCLAAQLRITLAGGRYIVSLRHGLAKSSLNVKEVSG